MERKKKRRRWNGKEENRKKATVVAYGFFNGYFGDTPRENAQASGEATRASPFECGSRVNSRDSPKWRACSQAKIYLPFLPPL